MPPLTIILPTYNGERFLAAQLNSILAQTDGDFILMTVDDGSGDRSAAILDDYARRDARIRRLPADGNVGHRLRLRQLAAASTTEYLAIADQDDVWRPERNARLLAAIGDRAMAFGRSQLMDGDGRDLGRSILEEHGADPRRAGPLRTLFWPLVPAHAAIMRRDAIDPATFTGPRQFDYALSWDAMLSTGLVYVDDAVVMHRIHDDNQMNGGSIRSRPKLLSRQRLRQSTAFVQRDRLDFYRLIDQLSRLSAVSGAARGAFRQATQACRYAWYQHLDFRPGRARRLEAELHRLLDGFARDAEDLAIFTERVASLVRPQFAPLNIARGLAHYRGRTQ